MNDETKRPAHRPIEHEDPIRTHIYLAKRDNETALRLGNGNRTLGIRTALREAEERRKA